MNNLIIGIICFVLSVFLCFYSSKDEYNFLGYKSIQQRSHKDIWKWSNKCFGTLAMIGSSIYLIVAKTEELDQPQDYVYKINSNSSFDTIQISIDGKEEAFITCFVQ